MAGLISASAEAGAWLRDEGSGFLSFGVALTQTREDADAKLSTDLFFEYGYTPTLTLGVSATLVPDPITGFSEEMTGDGQVFARLPIQSGDGPERLAVEFGLGTRKGEVDYQPFAKIGLSWGRGIQIGGMSGWTNIDAALHLPLGESQSSVKLDATLGLNASDRLDLMAQAFWERDRFGQSLTLTPSAIWKVRSGPQRIVFGVERQFGRQDKTGAKLSLWTDF